MQDRPSSGVSVAGHYIRPGSQGCGRFQAPSETESPVWTLERCQAETVWSDRLTPIPFTASAMGNSIDTDLLPELSGETWVATTHLDEATGDLPLPNSEPDLIVSSPTDKTLTIVREWVRAGVPPAWSDCAGLFPELCLWRLQFVIYPLIRTVDCGIAAHPRRRRYRIFI